MSPDPVKTIGEAYARMGRAFVPEHADAIREYVARKPKDRHGKHRYSAEMWGLDTAELRESSRPYTDHYGIALEA